MQCSKEVEEGWKGTDADLNDPETKVRTPGAIKSIMKGLGHNPLTKSIFTGPR